MEASTHFEGFIGIFSIFFAEKSDIKKNLSQNLENISRNMEIEGACVQGR